jgi:hypothetical protein
VAPVSRSLSLSLSPPSHASRIAARWNKGDAAGLAAMYQAGAIVIPPTADAWTLNTGSALEDMFKEATTAAPGGASEALYVEAVESPQSTMFVHEIGNASTSVSPATLFYKRYAKTESGWLIDMHVMAIGKTVTDAGAEPRPTTPAAGSAAATAQKLSVGMYKSFSENTTAGRAKYVAYFADDAVIVPAKPANLNCNTKLFPVCGTPAVPPCCPPVNNSAAFLQKCDMEAYSAEWSAFGMSNSEHHVIEAVEAPKGVIVEFGVDLWMDYRSPETQWGTTLSIWDLTGSAGAPQVTLNIQNIGECTAGPDPKDPAVCKH